MEKNGSPPVTSRSQRFWRQVKELTFISAFFGWLLMLASRLAEPLMTLSVLYIIIEAGVPAVKFESLHNVSIAIMIAAPEIMLPGSFVIASQAHAQGNTKARWLYAMCWLFVALTIVTLVSLFILKLDGIAFSIVTCVRCAAGVGYSILIRVLSYTQDQQPGATIQSSEPVDSQEMAQQLLPLLAPHFNGLRATLIEEIKPLLPTVEPVCPPDYEDLARAIAPLMMPLLIEERRTFIEEVKTMVPQIIAPVAPQTGPHEVVLELPEETEMEREVRLEHAYQGLVTKGKRISGRALAELAHCNRQAATKWLEFRENGSGTTN